MIPAAVLKRMRQIGLTDDQFDAVAEMLEEVELASQVAHTPVRSARQERNARYYQAKKDRLNASESVLDKTIKTLSDASKTLSDENVSGTDLAHARVNPDPSLRSGSIVTPLPSVGPQAEKPKRVSGSALPQDWSPPEDLFAYGATLGLSRDQSAEILERMRLWAVANRNRAVARKSDWTSTMQGALRRDAAKFQARAGPARADPRDGLATVFRETLARVRDDERRQNETGGDGDVRSLPVVSAQPRADGFDVGGLLGGLKRFP